MISVVADLTVDPASSEQFRTAFLAYSEKVKRSEPGTLLYTLASGKEAGKFTVMELYADKSAIAAHMGNLKKDTSARAFTSLLGKGPSLLMTDVCGDIPHGLKPSHPSATKAIVAHFKVADGPAFEKAMGALAADVQAKEPGNLLYCLSRHKKDPSKYTITELYSDMAAIKAHNRTPYFKAAQGKFAKLLTAKPEVRILEVQSSSSVSSKL